MTDAQDERRKIYGVSELTRRIKETLEDLIGMVWVEGEISNLSIPSSGHMYFTLKDAQAQLTVVLFKGNRRGVSFAIKDGVQIRVLGELSVYEARGQYQLVARQVEEAGKGSLQERFEKLKATLLAEGLFAAERKRPLPLLPRTVGLVTSPTGAAVRDILNVLNRRFPNLHIILAPVRVQGEGSAEMIARAVEYFNRERPVDVLIVGRGGGSLEDLWAFNEEVVARALAASAIPVISAVGHETDFTIADFVADCRAPTPSAAAELVVGRKDAFESALRELERRLAAAVSSRAMTLRHRLTAAGGSFVFREPRHLLRHYRQRLSACQETLHHSLQSVFRQQQQRVDELSLQMNHRLESRAAALRSRLAAAAGSYVLRDPRPLLRAYRQQLNEYRLQLVHRAETAHRHQRQELARLQAQLRALSPRAVLQRGYSVTLREGGAVVRSIDEVQTGDMLTTVLARGAVDAEIRRLRPDPPEEGTRE